MGKISPLGQAAAQYDKDNFNKKFLSEAFEDGAVWQNGQYKRLIELIKDGCPILLCEGFEELVEQINNEIERLQDEN